MNFYKKYLKKPLRKLGEHSGIVSSLSGFLYFYARFVGMTTRWHIEGWTEALENARRQGIILVIWHGRALMMPGFKPKDVPVTALASPHRDGRLIAGLLHKFDIKTIDGSSNENAANTTICIIPDGPRGPRMRMSRSPIYYAWKTGKPIICGAYSIENSFIVEKAWDKMMIPLPFSRGVSKTSRPIYVPTDTPEKELESYRQQLEQELNQIQSDCDREMGRRPILPDTTVRKFKKL